MIWIKRRHGVASQVIHLLRIWYIAVVIIGSGNGLRIEARHRNQLNMSKLLLNKSLFSL